MLQRDGMVMTVMKVLVMVVVKNDDPDEAQLDGNDDGDDLPSSRRNFPGRFLPAGELSLCVCFPPRRGSGVYL
jgi:hypothetical protein